LSCLVTLPKLGGRGIASDMRLLAGEIINFNNVVAVGCIRKFPAEHLGVVSRLLHSIGGGVDWLRLDNRQWGSHACSATENVVIEAPWRLSFVRRNHSETFS
jgi:hypothetical protein